jgi:hypothetical protein
MHLQTSSSFPSLLRNPKEKNAMLQKILPVQERTIVSLEKTSPSLSIDDIEKTNS